MTWWLSAAAAMAIPTAAAAAPCELHLFALDLGGGPRPAGNLLARPLPASTDPLALINIMSPHDRMADVSDTEYREALDLPAGIPVIRHWDVALPAKVHKTPLPLVHIPRKCHAELIGYTSVGLMASRSAKNQNEVVISLVYREFAPGAEKPFEVRGGGYGAVDTEKKVGRGAALDSLHAASIAIVRGFGDKVAKKRAKIR